MSGGGSRSRPWVEDDFDALVLLLFEDLVSVRCIFERHAMGDDEAGIDVALLDAREQRWEVALAVRLAGLDGQRAIHDRTERHLVEETAIHAGDRDRSAVAAALDRLAPRRGPVPLLHPP